MDLTSQGWCAPKQIAALAPLPHVGPAVDETVIGSAFYVMELVEGRLFWDASLAELAPSQRAACYDELNRVIA
ncbi:MAG: hypothetical protein ACEQSK_13580, partial [Sphingomonadaceae bacterium]